jgi:hypothetical protein
MDKRPRKALLAPLTKVAGLFCARSLIEGCVLLLRLRIRRNTAGPQHDENNGRYAAEVRPHRSCGRQQLKTVPALIRPLGVRPNRLRKGDTYH